MARQFRRITHKRTPQGRHTSAPWPGSICQEACQVADLNMMGLIHSLLEPSGMRMPKVRVYPATKGSPNLLP